MEMFLLQDCRPFHFTSPLPPLCSAWTFSSPAFFFDSIKEPGTQTVNKMKLFEKQACHLLGQWAA